MQFKEIHVEKLRDTTFAEDRRKEMLAKGLTRKNPAKGTTVKIGGSVSKKSTVKCELGRGGHSVVLLCETLNKGKDEKEVLALKVQTPTRCLAWEYSILSHTCS